MSTPIKEFMRLGLEEIIQRASDTIQGTPKDPQNLSDYEKGLLQGRINQAMQAYNTLEELGMHHSVKSFPNKIPEEFTD